VKKKKIAVISARRPLPSQPTSMAKTACSSSQSDENEYFSSGAD